MTDIEIKLKAINAERQSMHTPLIGPPIGGEGICADGIGRFQHYTTGESIYWHPDTNAHLIYGAIKNKWKEMKWEMSKFGYPTTDELDAGSGKGRFNNFQHGTIIYNGQNGNTFAVTEPIISKWGEFNWDSGELGFPLGDEDNASPISEQKFEGGSIYDIAGVGQKAMFTKNKKSISGFLPSTSGFKFSNSDFPHTPDLIIPAYGQQIAIGDAANGLCGGMIYAARDFFQAGIPIPTTATNPSSGPLFDYIVSRLFASFDVPDGVNTYIKLMDPALPNIPPDGRSFVMTNNECPKIMADIDAGVLSPIGLIEVLSKKVTDLGVNHQVLVYAYHLDNTDLLLFCYDPNAPKSDTVVMFINIENPTTSMTTPVYSLTSVFCFFRTRYLFMNPLPALAPAPTPSVSTKTVSITNGSGVVSRVRFYNANDTVLGLITTLWDGTRIVPPGATIVWTCPNGFSSVKAVINGDTTISAIIPIGGNFTFKHDGSIKIINTTEGTVNIKMFKPDDVLQAVTVPDGDFAIGPTSSRLWQMPDDVLNVTVVSDGAQVQSVGRAGTITFSDPLVHVKNTSNKAVRCLFFKTEDTILLATLPGGDRTIAPREEITFSIPSDVLEVAVRVNVKPVFWGDDRGNAKRVVVKRGMHILVP